MTKISDLRVFARQRAGALPLPPNRTIQAFTPGNVIERYAEAAAGVRAAATGDNVIQIFEEIGEDWWTGGGVTAKSVAARLRAIGDREVEVHINSFGGDMFEGIAIYNVLREHGQSITVKIMGMAASAASIIAMAGDRIEIGAASFLMIHNCWVLAAGNRHELREVADWLEPFDQAMRDVYVAQTSQSAEAVAKWLDEETFMSGSLAIERGFADALLPADEIVEDEDAKAFSQEVNEIRAMEIALVKSGMTRTQARERINRIKGTPGAVPEGGTPGAATDKAWSAPLTGLLHTIRS